MTTMMRLAMYAIVAIFVTITAVSTVNMSVDRQARDRLCRPPYSRIGPVFLLIPCWLTEIAWEK